MQTERRQGKGCEELQMTVHYIKCGVVKKHEYVMYRGGIPYNVATVTDSQRQKKNKLSRVWKMILRVSDVL